MEPDARHCVVIGAGPAGLSAAFELSELGVSATVLEAGEQVGGLARTIEHRGYRFDIGGHRFFTKSRLVQDLWEEILGEDLLIRPRRSRIFYRGHFFDYPLKPANALLGLGPLEVARVLASYARARLRPAADESDFASWVSNRFGRRLFEIFFESYTEKVWGMPCQEISSEWAVQRIQDLKLGGAIRNAFLGSSANVQPTTLIEQFHYPRLGPGMMWERLQELLAARGVATRMSSPVTHVHHHQGRIEALRVRTADGAEYLEAGSDFISSMPLRELVLALEPLPPRPVLDAARRLRHRDFLTVGLIIEDEEPFPDTWIYVHAPEVRVARIQNFKRWSPEMVPDPRRTALGLEYFVQRDDELWKTSDADLVALATRECEALGLASARDVEDGVVIRMPNAYPVYDSAHRRTLEIVRTYLAGFENLQVIGRNGQHRYNNQDHSVLTGVLAARNIVGADVDVWRVNSEEAHLEAAEEIAGFERQVPRRLTP